MRIILSRKGFDSTYGGYPSPILPDGRLVSLPIPSNDKVKYSDLKLEDNKSYFDLMRELKPKIKYEGRWHELTLYTRCHLDPDINTDVTRRHKDWRACFGQINQSQSHLVNEGVRKGDLFLFFGWFKQTIFKDNRLCFDGSAPDLHILFGYLQIGKIISVNDEKANIPKWVKGHPHLANKYKNKNSNNTIYVARKNLSWNKNVSGAGIFKFNKDLVLTKSNHSRSKWDLPPFFKEVRISGHSKDSWKNGGYFKSADIGQEFVVEENSKIKKWAQELVNRNILERARVDDFSEDP